MHRNCGTNLLCLSCKILNYNPLWTDTSCHRNDELDIDMFFHVDDGLLFGPSINILRLCELLPNHVIMRIVGRLARLDDHMFFLGRVIVRTARGYSVEANPTYNPRRECPTWSGGLETCSDSKCQENGNERVAVRAGERETTRGQDCRGKAVLPLPGAC